MTSKPDLYPLVIGYDDGMGKRASGFVMRYFRSLSHASTLDSLSSSFMCNVVNEANTIIPPPYSCNNSIDELTTMGCDRADTGSAVSLTNNRTTSDVSSLAAQSPSSPPRATSPTIEVANHPKNFQFKQKYKNHINIDIDFFSYGNYWIKFNNFHRCQRTEAKRHKIDRNFWARQVRIGERMGWMEAGCIRDAEYEANTCRLGAWARGAKLNGGSRDQLRPLRLVTSQCHSFRDRAGGPRMPAVTSRAFRCSRSRMNPTLRTMPRITNAR